MILNVWILTIGCISGIVAKHPQWQWNCIGSKCVKQRVTPKTKEPFISFGICELLCRGDGSLWPKPTGNLSISSDAITIDPNKLQVTIAQEENATNSLIKHFMAQVDSYKVLDSSYGKQLYVVLEVKNRDVNRVTLHIDERYALISRVTNEQIRAVISADNYFGARHGLETLSQLIVYDDIYNELKMPSEVRISDGPVYTYRGVLIDTVRHYLSTGAIKRTIDGMAASKLNTLHWHMTDADSFPHVFPSHPELSELGAYDRKKVFTPADVMGVVRYGRERGVRILPELDAPGHVAEGWQDTGFLLCFNKQPFYGYCPSPPCGQLDPTKDELYDLLRDLYGDIHKQFDPDMFHMGGDEVSIACWNSSQSVTRWMRNKNWGTNKDDFMKLWDAFQRRALDNFDKATGQKLPVILWSSMLTEKKYAEKYLSKDRYIIQMWTAANDPRIKDLLKSGYKLILSNYDALYLDCGVSSFMHNRSNWCSPYNGWQKIYENSPAKIGGAYKNQFLGAEVTLWSEQIDETAVDSRIWPRAAAMAERLWGEPQTSWGEAEERMLIHRERLVQRGIGADALGPEWCTRNEDDCKLVVPDNLLPSVAQTP